ncbi:dynein axonemal heavy chain 14 [Phyllostomus discolor]|uniref:Dynein axonemal heavy chain 14 n=1 Tax=Phyllostomus discolor TaxID=89673 RepID=A0A833YBU9_9CHIR|nr:dynein axonemal heavy chain 14 [Phyllostomus discolor]
MATCTPTDLTKINQDASKEKSNTKSRLLKCDAQNCEYVSPPENQPAHRTEKEASKYRTFSASLETHTAAAYEAGHYPDYLRESRTQQGVAPEPADHKDKRKSKGKQDQTQDQTHAQRKPRQKRRVSYDRTEPEDDDVVRSIVRLREKLGCPTALPHHRLEHAGPQIAAQKILLKVLLPFPRLRALKASV